MSPPYTSEVEKSRVRKEEAYDHAVIDSESLGLCSYSLPASRPYWHHEFPPMSSSEIVICESFRTEIVKKFARSMDGPTLRGGFAYRELKKKICLSSC